eukprot:m.390823 g.390823  ORF g.390823 m.390823 type:complete len:276 (-) comp21065_c0_seq2:1443-2270(-)
MNVTKVIASSGSRAGTLYAILVRRTRLGDGSSNSVIGCKRSLANVGSSPFPLPQAPSGSKKLFDEDTTTVAPLTCKLVQGGAKGLALTCTPLIREDHDAPQRTWEDTWMEMKFPVSTNPSFANQVQTPYNSPDPGIRHGRVFELLDAFTAECAMRHSNAYSLQQPKTCVTVSINALQYFHRLSGSEDFSIRACMTWVGKSTMNVSAEVHQNDQLVSAANVLFAARTVYSVFIFIAWKPVQNGSRINPTSSCILFSRTFSVLQFSFRFTPIAVIVL